MIIPYSTSTYQVQQAQSVVQIADRVHECGITLLNQVIEGVHRSVRAQHFRFDVVLLGNRSL